MKDCKHEWQAQKVENHWGWVMEDVCAHCGSIGVLSEKPDENGFYQIVAKPWAKIFDLNAYRKRKEQADEQKQAAVFNGK